MKKTISYACILTAVSLLLIGCSHTAPHSPSGNDEAMKHTITRNADYIATAPKDMFEIADAVVEGTFKEPIGSYVSETSFPVTQRTFAPANIYKGNVNDEEITVEYYGGSVPMSSYLASLTEEQIEKRGIDYSAEEIAKMSVSYKPSKEAVSINEEDTYMLFLSYDQESGRYFILCDAYGACRMKDGLIYSLAEDAFLPIDFS